MVKCAFRAMRSALETELDRYLEQARGLFSARVGEVEHANGTVCADFDELRWFDLPAASLAATLR